MGLRRAHAPGAPGAGALGSAGGDRTTGAGRGAQPGRRDGPAAGGDGDPAPRRREQTLEVLLVRRNPEARFMGGAWVFPGGAVDRSEGEGDAGAARRGDQRGLRGGGNRARGRRRAGPVLALDHAGAGQDPVRYVVLPRARAPAQASPSVDGSEIVDARWISPSAALAAAGAGELFMVFPTIKHLEQLARFRVRRRGARARPRAGGAARTAARGDVRRDGADPAAGRAGIRGLSAAATRRGHILAP